MASDEFEQRLARFRRLPRPIRIVRSRPRTFISAAIGVLTALLLPASFRGRYRPTGPSAEPAPGTLEHFLTERYCLYSADRRGRIARLEIDHPIWPLQPAEAEIELNTVARAAGLTLPDARPLLHYSRRQDMVAWPPYRVSP